jgi:hypothetical protein
LSCSQHAPIAPDPTCVRTHQHALTAKVAPGFWNYRTDFFVVKLLNIKTHMSVAKLASGK